MTQQDDNLSQLKKALAAIKELRSRLDSVERAKTEPIAIIGMGCRFPGGANSPEQYWELLANGVDAITETPVDRWDVEELYDSDPEAAGKISSRWGGYLRDIDQFDPHFFGISPKEAVYMDPQQRLLLEVAYEALENAGQVTDQLIGSLTGVFVGVHSHSSDYFLMQSRDLDEIDTYSGTGTSHSVVSGRLSYLFDWRGPNISLDTACSSSLVAVHLAVQSLRNRESNLALAGGVNIMLSPEFTVAASRMHMLSPDGRCKAFDERADGFTRGEGCGVIVLKRLSDAQADGDHILAVIRGSAVNQDGKSNGLTAPNSLSQVEVIRTALKNGGVEPSQINYVEAHGTGTALGDPIEVEALGMVMGDASHERVYLGSAKTNIGHLEGAAGVAGLMKVVLSMQHRQLPPLVHFTKLNPHISFDNTPFAISTELIDWNPSGSRMAGLSSFGWSGTNAHIVLEEAPQPAAPQSISEPEQTVLLPLSAQTPDALRALAGKYSNFLQKADSAALHAVAYMASLRRRHQEYRLAAAGNSPEALAQKLGAFAANQSDAGVVLGHVNAENPPRLAMVFSGQGPQWAKMGWELFQMQPVFRASIERIDQLLKQYASWSLIDEVSAEAERTRLNETEIAQPAIFAIQVALAELWKSWGVVPEAVVGHSVGEVAAAHVAGVLTLEDSVRVIFHRGRLMQRVTGKGKMAAIGLSVEDTQPLLAGYEGQLSIGAVNSPISTVLSGEQAPLEAVLEKVQERGVFNRMLTVNYAFHSPQMEPLQKELTDALAGIAVHSAQIPIYSTVSGKLAGGSDYNAAYWAQNIRQPVRFADAVIALMQEGFNLYLELSPHPVLAQPILQCATSGNEVTVASSIRREQPELQTALQALGLLYTQGYAVEWERLYPNGGQVVTLPNYVWQRSHYWIEAKATKSGLTIKGGHPLIGQRLPELAHLPQMHVWENRLEKRFKRYVEDHFGGVLGEAFYKAVALAAANDLFGKASHQIFDLALGEPLTLAEANDAALQIVITAESEERASFQVFTREVGDDEWVMRAGGQIQVEQAVSDWLYQLEWLPILSEPTTAETEAGHWLIFSDQQGVGAALVKQLTGRGATATVVSAGTAYQKTGEGTFTVNPKRAEDFKRLFADVGVPCRRILYLCGLDLPEADALRLADLPSTQAAGESVVYLVQALATLEWSRTTELWLITRNVQAIGNEQPSGVAQAPLWGLGRVIALEQPALWGGLIDLPQTSTFEADAEILLREMWQAGAEDQIAYRNGQRYVARLDVPRFAYEGAFEWKPDATYLITGGLRGLGLLFARRLVEQGVRHLVLMGRSGAPESAQATLDDLKSMGVDVMIAKADVASYNDLQQVLQDIEQKMPPLRGVIHSAAVIDDVTLLQLDGARYATPMNAKVNGTTNLHLLTKDIPLDCFVVFSSFASVFGSAGQANYAAANAFVDALMQYRHAHGLAGLSVNWGPWDEVGMAASMDHLSQIGLRKMNPKRAMAALAYLLGAGAAQTIVADVDWSVYQQVYATQRNRPFLDLIRLGAADTGEAEQEKVNFADLLQQTPENERYSMILNRVRDEAAFVLGFSPAESLDLKRGFFKMGMDSLMSVQLRNRLENNLGCFLPPTVALEYPTVEALTNYVAYEVFKLSSGETAVEQAVPEANAGEKLESLSDDQLLALLDDELAAIEKLTGDDE